MPNWIFLHPTIFKLWVVYWIAKSAVGMGIVTYAAWKARKEDERS